MMPPLTKINALLPLKITNHQQFISFKRCFMSYYNNVGHHDISYILCDDSIPLFRDEIQKFLNGLRLKYEYVRSEDCSFYEVVSKLIQAVSGDYFFFIIDDVELLDKDFVAPAIEAMERDNNLSHIKIGGGYILEGDHNTNATYVKRINNDTVELEYNINQRKTNPIYFNRMKVKDNSVWVTSYINSDEQDIRKYEPFVLGYWNDIMRADYFKDIDIKVSKMRKKDPTFHYYAENSSKSFKKELKDRKVGYLNFANYLYAWGRWDYDIDHYKNNCRNEIK
jgi:hypothetical protein